MNKEIPQEEVDKAIEQILRSIRRASFDIKEVSDKKQLDDIEFILTTVLRRAGVNE